MYNMPYSIRKTRGRKCYQVKNRITKKILSKCTSLKKAKKQVRLMYALEDPTFVPRVLPTK